MKIVSLVSLLLILFLLSCKEKLNDHDQLIVNRLEYANELKIKIEQDYWQHFDNYKFEAPIIYYDTSSCYIVNPSHKFLEKYKPYFLFKNNRIIIYKLDSIVDQVSSRITTHTFYKNKHHYAYRYPYIKCYSPEKVISSNGRIKCTEQWLTSIIHEYFHGFQLKHITFLNNRNEVLSNFSEDSLGRISQANTWFQESVFIENELLLKALNSESRDDIFNYLELCFELRDVRRNKYLKLYNSDIELVEKTYEDMEGTARYVQYQTYKLLSYLKPNNILAESDSLYLSNVLFKNFKLENEEWFYKSGNTRYFYQTGFNIIRLLEKLKIEYKSRMFVNGEVSLESILRDAISEQNLNKKEI